ncbi:endolytic transglycosylase MltG [Halopseudomonas salegens]|uniref:Endolytic murein transglycosylase n=1 Tax=Halopseudomonas salegens TaxID=1434072 RepID=A0A1H2EZN3_9GAMM|nr:endolytic transglycosylase MltG [Halopseudomonas salegens]SDU00580.1 UPF0755 protein [Halopseudomonas salegens]
MKAFVKYTALLLIFLVVATGSVLTWGYFTLQQTLAQPLAITEPRTLEVEPGTSPGRLLASLERDGWLQRAEWLRRYWQFQTPEAVLQVGEYEVPAGITAQQLLGMLQRGDVVRRQVTLVEGRTFQQFRQVLATAERLQQTLSLELTAEEVMAELGLAGEHPEGRFFPDTYQYTRSTSDRDILLRAYERMATTLEEVWAQRADDLPIETPYEALILASIIERETGAPHERGEIAGVFTRRLRIGMRLQTDPTVIYGMGDAYEGRILRRHLREPTPWNTYTIDGLPPTPIAMPGREALLAAVNPEPGSSLYFVARGDGTHKFSDNLREHNRAVRNYQIENRADNYRSSPAPNPPAEESQP